jgi:predicted secreted protein
MACLSGKNGALSVDNGVSNVAQLTSWTITQNAEVIEATHMRASGTPNWMCKTAGALSWEGSAEALFDTTETYPTIGAEVQLIAYEADSTTTYTGDAIITSIETVAGVEDMMTVAISFTGTGSLTTS